MIITRAQMIEAVRENAENKDIRLQDMRAQGKRKTFAYEGKKYRRDKAVELLTNLEAGYPPSVQEVVAYFGKGARFAE